MKKRTQFGAYHHLVQELQISPEKHLQYFRMSTQQMEDLLSIIGPDITGMSINYRTPIGPKEKHLGYACNPRSLKEGMETSRRMTDEIGISPERPIPTSSVTKRANGYWYAIFHPAAADHSVSKRGSRFTALIHAFAEEPSR